MQNEYNVVRVYPNGKRVVMWKRIGLEGAKAICAKKPPVGRVGKDIVVKVK